MIVIIYVNIKYDRFFEFYVTGYEQGEKWLHMTHRGS